MPEKIIKGKFDETHLVGLICDKCNDCEMDYVGKQDSEGRFLHWCSDCRVGAYYDTQYPYMVWKLDEDDLQK